MPMRAVLLAFLVGAAIATGAVAARAETVELAGRQLSLVAPDNYCLLDPAHPVDAQVIEQVTISQAGLNHVAMQFADCGELDELRNGRRTALGHFGAIMMPLVAGAVQPATGLQRAQLIAGIKSTLPAIGPAETQKIVDMLNARIPGEPIKGFRILGPVFEDGNGLYIAMIGATRLNNQDIAIAGMWGATLLRSVVTNVYLYQPAGQGAFDTLLMRIRPLVAELVRRNP
jgi:hypothetical protein